MRLLFKKKKMRSHRKDITFNKILKGFEKKLKKLKTEHKEELDKEVKKLLETKIKTMERKILAIRNNETYNPFTFIPPPPQKM